MGKTSRRNITGGENSPVEVLSESGGYLCILISAWQTGESGGYTGGGGPGLSDEGIDTPADKLKNN